MSSWEDLRRVLETALEAPPGDRERVLREACGDDGQLRSRALELLAREDGEAGTVAFERQVPDELLEGADDLRVTPGTRIGGYRIVGFLGAGGMSTVFEAEQENPRRTVALKTLRAGLLSVEARRRFEYESEILAQLRHPGIAQVYEVGTWREPMAGMEVPFFAMEYVADARPFDRFAREQGLGLRVLEPFLAVCDAVGYGHRFGVIHRDLKPANVLVDREGRPKVIDFGIARATDAGDGRTLLTGSGEVLGTLRYMAPEQLDGIAEAADTRADVYALGVMLYQVLANAVPFEPEGMSLTAFAKLLREREPEPPSQVMGSVSAGVRELDWIIRRAMAADKEERYPSVAALAEDLVRFQRQEPLLAGPPTRAYRLRKFVARNRRLVAAAALVMVTLLAGIAGTTWQMFAARAARDEATRKAERAENVAKLFQIFLGLADPWERRIEMSGPEPTMREGVLGLLGLLDEDRLKELTREPDVEASVRHILGHSLDTFGLYEESERQLRLALKLRTEALGPSHPDVAEILNALANVISGRGRREEAARYYRRALAIREQHLGAGHRDVGVSVLNLAIYLDESKHHDEALRLGERALRIFRGLSGQEQFVAITLSSIGTFLEHRGELDRAIARRQEAIAAYARAKVAFHPWCASTHRQLAAAYEKKRQHDLARRHYGEARAIYAKSVGPDDERTLGARVAAASVAMAEDYAAAVDRLAPLVEPCEKSLGAGHPCTRTLLARLAEAYGKLGRTADQERIAARLRGAEASRAKPAGKSASKNR